MYARFLIRKPYLRGSKIWGGRVILGVQFGEASAAELEARNERKRRRSGYGGAPPLGGFAIAQGLELSWRVPASCLYGRERALWPLYIVLPRARWDVSHHLPWSAALSRDVRRITAASEAHCGRDPGGALLDFPLTSCLRYFLILSRLLEPVRLEIK